MTSSTNDPYSQLVAGNPTSGAKHRIPQAPLVFQTNVTPASLPENGARGNPSPGAGGGSPASGVLARIIDHADIVLVTMAIVAVAYLIGMLVYAAGVQQ